MEAMDAMMADDAYLKEMIKKGNDPMQEPNEMKLNETLFGEAAAVSVTVENADKELFDYKAEMEVAKAEFPAMKDKLYGELDELAKKQPGSDPNEQLQDLMMNLQTQPEKADVNDAVVKQASDVNSTPESELLKKAVELERERKLEEAIGIYLSVAENPKAKDKDVIKARTYLARSYIKTKEYEKAKQQLEKLISDFSDNRVVLLRSKKQLSMVKKMLGEPAVDAENIEALKEKLKTQE
jgi:tetratricopeptide (TPR) repeat protein